MQIICGRAHPELGEAICRHAGQEMARADITEFPDSETNIRILDDVRGKNVFIIQPTVRNVNQSLMELLMMADAARRASSKSVTAVTPYFGYARQDRKHEGRVPISAKLVANLITTAGINRVVTVDLHSPQIQGFFDIPVDHLFATPVMAQYLNSIGLKAPVIMASDIGGMKMADRYAKKLGGDLAVIHKRRLSATETRAGPLIGEVRARDVIIADDVISTGGTMAEAAKVARDFGARTVRAVATHGLFVGNAWETLSACGITEVIVTDSSPLPPAGAGGPPEGFPLRVLSLAPLLAEAISRIHKDRSLSLLFE